MEFGKRPDIADTTDFCSRQLVIQTCCGLAIGEVANLLMTCYRETGRGIMQCNACNALSPLSERREWRIILFSFDVYLYVCLCALVIKMVKAIRTSTLACMFPGTLPA